jgi:hypothetical protein
LRARQPFASRSGALRRAVLALVVLALNVSGPLTGAAVAGAPVAAPQSAIDTAGAGTPIVSTRGHFLLRSVLGGGPAGTLVAGESPTGYEITPDVPGLGAGPCVGELVVYVHGYNTDTQRAISNFNLAKHSLAANDHPRTVVGFSWDANPALVDPLDPVRATIGNFGIAEDIATQNGAKLAQLILDYQTICSGSLVRLMSHSLGVRVVLNALEQLRRHNDREPTPLVRVPANAGRRIEVASVHVFGAAVNNEEIAMAGSSAGPSGPRPTFGRAIEGVACEFHNKFAPLDNVLTVHFSLDRIVSGFVNVALGLRGAESGIERPANYHEEDVSLEIITIDQDGVLGPDLDPVASALGVGLRLDTGQNHSGYVGVERPFPRIAYDDGAIDLIVKDWQRQPFAAGCLKNLSGNAGSSGFQDVAAIGDQVHVVWEDRTTGNFDVLVRTSRDGGATFGRTVNLSGNAGDSRFPRVAVSGAHVYVTWSDNTRQLESRPGLADILVRVSRDAGATFGPTVRVSEGDGGHGNARVAAAGQNGYVVWSSNSYLVFGAGSISGEVYARAVSAVGVPGPLINVSEGPPSDLPDVAASEGIAHVVWQARGLFPDSNGLTQEGEVWYREIGASGTEPRAKENLSRALSATSNSVQAKVAAANGDVYVLWNDDVPGNYDTFVRVRRAGETAFGPPLNVSETPTHSFGVALAVDATTPARDAYVAWSDGTRHDPPAVIGTREVYVRPLRAAGASLGPAVNLSANAALSIEPAIAAANGSVYVAWPDRASGNYDTHFRASLDRGSTFLPAAPERAVDLSANKGDTWVASVAAAGDRFYAAWTDFTPGRADVLFRAGRSASSLAPFGGRIVVHTPDRGDLPLRRMRVQLVHGLGTITTFTDDDGRFRTPLPPGTSAFLRLTLTDADGVIAVQHVARDQNAAIETPTFDLASRRADIVLSAGTTQFRLNGTAFTPAAADLSGGLARVGDFPHLAALYHYSLVASDFMRTRLPGVFVDGQLPLEVVGFSSVLDAGGVPAQTRLEPEPTILIRTRGDPPGTPGGDPGGSNMADGLRVEQELDTLFHEFGHYVEFESRLGAENAWSTAIISLHPALSGLGLDKDCHQGYAQVNSSCAWSEGFATFIGAVINDAMLTDPAHARYRARANVDMIPGGAVWPLEPRSSVVGPRLGAGGIHVWSPLSEELAVSSILWDLYDSRTGDDDPFAIPLPQLWRALTDPSNSSNPEIIGDVDDLFGVLATSGLADVAALKALFASFDMCVDTDGDLDCDGADFVSGSRTIWRVAFLTGGPAVFAFPNGRFGPAFVPKQGITLRVVDELGRAVDGLEMSVRLRYPDGSEHDGTIEVERGTQTVGFLMPHPAQATLTFTKPGHEPASALIDSVAYWAGATDAARTHAMDVPATMRRLVNAPPRIGGFAGNVDEDTIVALTLRGADDEGDPLTFRIVTSPAVGTLTAPSTVDASSAVAEYAPPADFTGTVRFTYVANDGRADSEPGTVELTFRPIAEAPLADAGADQDATAGATVTLDGGASRDADGDALAFSWTQLAGAAVTLSDAAARAPTFTAPGASGTLLFQLRVVDTTGRSALDVAAVAVRGATGGPMPVAEAGVDVAVDEGATVALDGSASSDPTGAALSFSWTQLGGPAVTLAGATTARPTFTAPAVTTDAIVSFELAVRARGFESRDVVNVVVRDTAGRTGPVADAGANMIVLGGATVVLDGSASTAPGSLTYAWTQLTGDPVTLSDASAARTTFVAPRPFADTVLAFQLVVTDAGGVTATDAVTLLVRPAIERSPLADAGEDRTVAPGDVVVLDGSGSRDPDADPLTFRWSQVAGPEAAIDGVTSAAATVTVPAAPPGTVFSFLLRVDDGRGLTAVDGVNLIVPALPPSHAFDAPIDLSESPIVSSDIGGDPSTPRGSVVASGDVVHVVFGEGAALLYRRSTDAGRTFGGPIVLTDVGATGLSFDPQIRVVGDDVYIAWWDRSLGNAEVLLRKSTDGGATFGPAVNVSADLALSSQPRLAVAGPNVYVAWTGSNAAHLRRSTDGGATFGPATTLSRPFTESGVNSIVASGERVHVLFGECSPQCFRATNRELLVRTSTDGGLTFAPAVLLSDLPPRPPCLVCTPTIGPEASLAVSGSTVHVTWVEIFNPFAGFAALVHRRSTDGGETFGPVTDMVDTGGALHRLAVTGQTVYVVYQAGSATSFQDVFLRRSADDGATFSPPVNVSAVSGAFSGRAPEIALAGDDVHVVWKGSFDASYHVMLRASTDGGRSFAAPQDLSGGSIFSGTPVAAAGANVYVAWEDTAGRPPVPGTGGATVPDVIFRRGTRLPPGDLPPVANAGPDRAVDGGATVTLDGTLSADPEGAALAYLWEQIAGPAVTLADPRQARTTFTAPAVSGDSVVVLRLVVSDGVRSSTPDVVTVVVRDVPDPATDLPPIADAGGDRIGAEGSEITLDGSGSSDPEGASVSYSWAQLSGPEVLFDDSSAERPVVTLPQVDGDVFVTLQLVVSDGELSSAPAPVTILVRDAATTANRAPIADAGTDQIVTPGARVALDGSASADPDGDAVGYSWVQVAGPVATLSDPSAAGPTFTAPAVGSLVFALTASDGRATSVPDAVTIAVRTSDAAPALPTADAGPDRSVPEGESAALDGTRSTGIGGGALTYSWRQLSGPLAGLTGTSSATASVAAPAVAGDAVLVFELVVSEGGVPSAPDAVAVVVLDVPQDKAPTAGAGPDQTVDAAAAVALDGRASADPEARPLSFNWIQVEGPSVALVGEHTADPRFSAPATPAGARLVFELVVDDGTSPSAPDRVTITVRPVPQGRPPVAHAGDDRTVTRGASVALDGARSADPDGDALAFRWAQVGGPAVALAGATTAASTFGTASLAGPAVLAFELTVDDGRATASDVVTVNVTVPGQPRAWVGGLPGPVEQVAGTIGLAAYLAEFIVDRPPAFDAPPSPPAGSTITVIAGDAFAFSVRCSDPDHDGLVIGASAAPAGARVTAVPPGAEPAAATFAWIPTASQETVVTFTCRDVHGASASHTVRLVVRTAGDAKRDVIAALTPHVGPKGPGKDVAEAIEDIRRSLAPTLWRDATHLDPKHGERVFAEERNAAKELEDVAVEADAAEPARAAARHAAERLVAIDRVLALVQMRDALALAPLDAGDRRHVDHHNAKAAEALAEGDRARADGRGSHAISRYRQAWHHAMHVVEHPRADHVDADDADDDEGSGSGPSSGR